MPQHPGYGRTMGAIGQFADDVIKSGPDAWSCTGVGSKIN